MQHLDVSFHLVSASNPDDGYGLKIIDPVNKALLYTRTAPDTGKRLLTPADCMRVIAMYIPGQKP